jgi:rfaE bifunctional protein nucleotidyltransferase chain/domain
MKTLEKISHKIVSLYEAKTKIEGWQNENEKVVFTNGCFDILHLGHVTYLAQSSDEGQRLVIGLNSDISVRKLEKGADRPVNTEHSRAVILAALDFVDLIVLFDDENPLQLISELKPDILIKGSDYDPNETDPLSKSYIVGSIEVKKYGGLVKSIPLVQGFSTTGLLERIKNKSPKE